MVKKITVLVAAIFLMIQLAACGAPEVQTQASAEAGASTTAQPEASAPALTNVSQAADKYGYYTCDYNGVKRKYILYIPEGAGDNAPLVFMLHGYASNSKSFMDFTGMNSVAERYGYAVVYPQGIGNGTNGACWNSGFTLSNNDDLGFLVALAKYLQQQYGLNSKETFAAGFSNGAFMMYKLACKAPDTFRAVASVAGIMNGGEWDGRKDSASVGILQINGTKDNAVPINGSRSVNGIGGGSPAVADVIEYWTHAENLSELEEVKLSDRATAYKYSGSENDNLVWYIEIKDGSHSWPVTDTAGFDANEVILEYFSNYVN